jgi:filamentous hemagglutinin family protein
MKRPIASHRAQLLARSALCGVLAAMAIGASSAMAQVTGVGTINSTNSNGALPGVVSGGGVTDITMGAGASRSIVNWANLTVTPTESLNFHFNNRSDIVVNRVAGAASINGVLNGCLSTCAVNGGNIWILSTGGVLIGANAQINTGGFLASTGSLTDSDILDGDMNFAFTGAPANSTVNVAAGASLNTNGGSLALIAPIVTTAAGSTVTATNGGDVVYGSAENYNVTFAPTGADDLDLITFEVPSRADGAGGTPGLTLNGTTNANQVFAAIVSKSGVAASILLGGNITATTASGENGDIVLSAGSGFVTGLPLNPGGGFEGSITQDAGATLTGANVTMRAADAIVAGPINATGQVWLDSAWAGISQTGAITASSLRAEAGAGIDLTDVGNDFDTISLLDNNGAGVVSLTDADGFQITGGVNNWATAGTVNLTALNGSITQSGMGVIWAGRLNASATGDIALGNLTNHLATLGTLTAGGAVSYRGGTNFSLDGAVTAASLSLRSDTGAITQIGGFFNVGQLSVQAETGINLNRVNNQIDAITGLATTAGDIVLISNGDLSLAGNVAGGGVVSFQIFSGGITQNSGVITAGTFTATADTGLNLGGENQVGQLGRLAVGGTGDITFRNAGALVLTDDIIAAGDNVNLYSTSGAITQNSGAITANRLTASAAGNIQLNTATNNAATIGGLASTGGSILYRNANSFDIQGDITTGVGTGVVLRTVNAGASITQVSGTIDVGWFGANANGSIIVNGASNQIRRLVATSSSTGDVSIRTTTDLAMGQPVTASQTLSLTSGGRIYQDSTGYVVANTLNLSAVTGISLPNAGPIFVNSVQNLGTITNTTSGGIVIANYSGSNTGLTGNITAAGQSVSITDVAGGLNQTGGIITAGTLSASGTGHVALYNSNAVDNLGDLTSSSGNVSFRNVGDVNVNGSIASVAGGAVTLRSNTGAINLSAGPITSGWISLEAGTTISQAASATLTANALSLTAGGNVSLAEANNFNTIYDLNVAGDLTLRNFGTIDMNPVISGGYSSGGALTLISDTGNIRTTGAGITTSRLTASAAGFIDLNGTIASLGDIAAGGNILLNTFSGGMDLTGDITGGTVSLYADGGVIQSGGRIDATRLNVVTNGAISLTGANEIDVIGRLETDQLSSGTGADITLRNVGDIVLDYLIGAAGATVTLTSDTGAITQTGFSAMTANRLIASAVGNITLYDGVNNVATIGGLASANGDIVYRDVDGFDIQGDITANSAITRGAMLVAGGAGGITQTSGVLDVGYFRGVTGGSITLGGANRIRRLISTVIGNGALTLNTTTDLSVDGTVSANAVSLSSTGAITQAANAQIWTNTLNASAVTGINLTASGFGANNISNLGLITNTTSGGVAISNATNMNLTGNVTATGQAVSISNTLGGINQTGGVITADSLSLSATGGISVTRNNVFGSLGAVTAGGNVAITNVGDLNLTGTVNTGGGDLTLTSNTGQIQQTGGVVTANVVNLQAAGRIWLNNANAVTSFGTVTAGGHILLRNDSSLVVGGDITANGFDVTLRSNTGSITQTAGSDITSRYLQVIAATGVTLTNLGNAIDEIAWVQTNSGGFAFGQTNGFQISGPVMAGGQTVSLTSLNGAITQTSGSLSAGTLNASAAGTLTLNQGNNVDSLGVISTGGSFLFRDVTGFNLTGDITAASQVVMLAQGGSINQTGGIITADSINAMASVDLLLGGLNQINSISSLAAANNILYRQVGDLSVPTISAAGTVSLYSTTGDITQTGTITADTLTLGAGGDITLGQNFVSRLGQIDAGGDFTAADAGGLSSGALGLTGNITVGGAMTLVNPGAIFQTSSTGITAGSLFIDTDGALGATGANSISGNTRLSATDAIFNAVGDLTLQVNVTGFATITSTGAVVFDGVGASTGDTLVVQAVNGISQGAQALTFTNFGNLTNTTTGGINLTNSSWLNLNGAISAVGQGVTLNVANGGIIQSSGSNINAQRLSVTTTQGAIIGEVNQVAELGDINVGAHNFSFRTLGDLLIDGDITSSLNVMLTSATGRISQTAGSDITAGGLNVWAETGINLTNAGNNAGRILGLFNLGSGGIAYSQTNGVLIDGTIRALNQTVSLTSLAGGISETNNIFFPQIEAGTLNLSAGGAITLHRDNDVDNLGVVTAGGDFTFNDVDGFNLTGNIGAGATVLIARAGSIGQTGGVITATSLNANATGALDLDRANLVSGDVVLTAGGDIVYREAGSVSVGGATAGGAISLRSNTGAVTQVGAITGATLNVAAVTGIALNNLGNDIGALGTVSNTTSGQVSFTNSDGFDLTGAITAGGSQFVSLTSINGGITQQAGGTITAQVLSLSAWSGATLGGDNDVDALGVIIAGPSFLFNDIDDFDVSGMLNAQTADLTAAGAITQSAGNLNVGTLSLTAASVALDGVNDITVLGDVDVTGDMSFSDADGFQLAGSQTVDGTLALTAGTFITQQSGGLDVGRLEIDAGTDVDINMGGNVIDVLGDVTSTSGRIAIVNNAFGALEIDGDVSAAAIGQTVYISSLASGVTMTSAGSITSGANAEVRGAGNVVLGDIDAGGALTVVSAGGSVSSTAAPTIIAAQLTGSATGDFILTGSNIGIDEIGYMEVGDTFSITGNNGPLDLSNNIIAQTVLLGTTGALTQTGGSVDATTGSFSAGGSLTMGTNNAVDTVNLNGASVTYNSSGSFAANVVTSTGAVTLRSTTGKITQTASTGRIVADSLTASAATGLEFFGGQNDIRVLAGLSSASGGVTYRDMGGFEITGDIDAAGQTVELVSDGAGADGDDVVQSGGVITANRLQGTSAGDLLFNSANVVGRVHALNAGGALTYRGAGNVELWDNLTAGTTLNLISDTASVLQQGGVITAQTLTGSAALGLQLSRLNDVDNLGAITASNGEFSFRDTDGFNITGAVSASDSVILQAGTDIVQTTGSLATNALSVFANGLIDLDGPGNDIASLAAVFAGTDFRFADVSDFTLDGDLFAGGVMTLSAGAGNINQNAGVITAGTLNASAASELNFTRANAVTTLGNLSAGDRIFFSNTDGFSIAGNLASNQIVLASIDGGVTQTGGAITAGALAVDAELDVVLGQAGNDVDTLNLISVRSGDFTYRDADSVSLSGPVSMSGVATFNVGGDLTQSGTGLISASRVQGSAGGAFALGDLANNVGELGPITADRIAFVSSGGLNLAGALTATNGVELKADTGITQSVGAVITGTTLRVQANGDIILDQDNDLDSVTLLYSQFGDITYSDVDGFSFDPTVYGDIWTTGTMTLRAGSTGGISQTGAGLRAGTLIVSAGGDIVLGELNRIDVLGASSSSGSVFTVVNDGDLDIAGDISVTGPLGRISLTSNNGAVDQITGEIDAYVVHGSAAGDFRLTRFTGAVGNIASSGGDIDIRNVGDVTLFGLLQTGRANSVSLLSSGGGIWHGVGRIETGTLNLSAVTGIALDGAQGNDIYRLGVVSTGSNFTFADDDDFALTGDITVASIGGHVGLRSNGGAITQTGGVITAHDLNLEAATGLDLIGANRVDKVTIANGATGAVVFSNAQALTVLDATSTGDVTVSTTAGLLTLNDITTGGLIRLAGAGGVFSGGTLSTDGDVDVSASAGDIEIRNIVAGDDVTVTAVDGQAQLWNLILTGASDGEGTGQHVVISASGDAFLGARDEAGIGLYASDLSRTGGAGTLSVTSTGGNAGAFLTSIDAKIDTLTAGGATGTATIVAANGDIRAGTVTGHNVVLKAVDGDVDPDAVSIGGGDYTLTGRDILSGAFGFTGTARDILITDTAGALTLTADMTAQRHLTINAVGDVLGGRALVAGADAAGQGNLSIQATGIVASAIGADGDVTLDAGSGDIDVGTLVVMNDYRLSGGSFSTGALSPIGAMAGTWTLTDTGGFDFTGLTLTYNGDIEINAADVITGGSVQSILGSVRIGGPADIDVEGLYAAGDVTVASAGALSAGSATAYGGSISLTGASVTIDGYADASGDVLMTAVNGTADIASAMSGGDITVLATNGDARLGSANLTGLTGDLIVSATDGDAILGAVDYTGISTDNVLTRAAGGTGTVTVTAANGDARVYLDTTNTLLNLLQGDNVDVTIASGGAAFDTLTALNGDIYVETLDGALTIRDATAANGGVALYAAGGDLALIGSVFGASEVIAQTDGLLDGRQAVSLTTDGDLSLSGGDVVLNTISADGDITVAATDGDAYVEFANAGGLLQVGSIAGNATLRGAEAGDGIGVFAALTATFGADTKALITGANRGVVGACGCGGIVVASLSGDVNVNLDSVVGDFAAISALTGDVNVNLLNGNLTIGELSGRNITVEVAAGSIETGAGGSPIGANVTGGSYSITAQDFLGDVLNPLLQDEFGAPSALRNYTIVDTLGGLDMTGVSVAAQGDIRIEVRGAGALTGDAELAADGDVTVSAAAIQADVITAGRDVDLNASAGTVNIATRVTVGRNYTLVGRDFSIAALSPLGARAGDLSITDTFGDLDYSGATLRYGGDINIQSAGLVVGGDVTSDNGDILIQGGAGIDSGALSAANGTIDAYGYGAAGVTVASATARDSIYIYASSGDAVLGAAALLGTGANQLRVHVDGGSGNAVLGGVLAGGVTAANRFTSAGSTTTTNVSSTGGDAFVHLDTSDAVTSVFAGRNVGIVVRNGDFTVGSVMAANGRVDVEGPTGGLTIGDLNAARGAQLLGADITLASGTVGEDLIIDASGDIRFLGAGRIVAGGDASLSADGRISQAGDSAFRAASLTVDAGDAVNLLGLNDIATIRAVDVATGGFAYRSVRVGGVEIAGAVNAAGQTVDLRAENGPLTQSGAGIIVARRLTGFSDGGATLGAANRIDELGDFAATGGGFFLNVDGALSIVGTVDSVAALRIQSGPMTVASTGTVRSAGSGDAVVLASNGVFTNNSGADGVQAANGRWLIYSQAAGNPGGSTAGNNFGGLGGRSYYGSSYDFGSGAFSGAPNAGNRFVYAYQPTLTVTPISQRITYNGQIPTLSALIAGLVNGDLAADAWSGAPLLSGAASKNVGTYGLSAALGSLLSDMNYAFSFGSGTLIIDPKALTGTVVANNRTYDGTTGATGSISLTGVVAGDSVGASGTLTFDSRNAGVGRTVTAANASLSGTDAGNYILTGVASGIADILRRSLTGVLTANSRTYDGTTAATGSISLTGVVAGDTVTANGTFNFADRNAGVGKVVTASDLILSGADAGNYDLGPISGVADILRRSITGTVVANNKTYDGTTGATGSISLTGVVGGDNVGASGTLTFDNRNAGVGRIVTAANASLSGTDAGNYILTGVASGMADILRRAISVTADNQSRRFGQPDPFLSYVVGGSGLVQGDVLTGGLVRVAGETAGVYAIQQGDLAASSNYVLTFTPGEFVIQIPPAGGIQSLQMLRALGEAPTFALDRDPSPDLIEADGAEEQDPEHRPSH